MYIIRHAPVQRFKAVELHLDETGKIKTTFSHGLCEEKSQSLLSPSRGRVQAIAVSINSINRMERQMGEIPVVH